MFVVTLFSTVSASWGTFDANNCKDHAPDAEGTGNCLRAAGEQWPGNRWSMKDCTDSFGKANGKPNQCGDYDEVPLCCGKTCLEAAPEIPCSSRGGVPQPLIDAKGQCDEENSCEDFQTLIEKAKGLGLTFECVKNTCVPTGDSEEDVKQTTKKPTTDKNDENKDDSNAFAMGLSTLAVALVFLQF